MKPKNKKASENQRFSGHFFLKGKKAIEIVPSTIVVFAIIIIVFIILIAVFSKYFAKEAGTVGEQLDSLGDCDKDGVANFLDKCPCLAFKEGEQSDKYAGCPNNTEPKKCTDEEIKTCQSK